MGVRMHRDTIDAALTRAARRWADELGRAVVDRAQAILAENGHVDTGALSASISHTIVGAGPRGAKVVVGSSKDYAAYFHTGTGVHGPTGMPIVPTRKRSVTGGPPHLKFTPKGASAPIFRRSVKGMRRDPFLADALRDVFGSETRIRSN